VLRHSFDILILIFGISPPMSPTNWYYLWASLLLIVNLCGWASTLVMLPGNWFIVLATALFAFFVRPDDIHGVSWWCVVGLVVLAAIGEAIEFAAGAAGAAKHGGSRRGMLLAIAGAIGGSLLGATLGSGVPILGTILGAVAGGCVGAFGGAYLGETWKGRTGEERMAVSNAALVGRLFGTVGKLIVGLIMVVIATVDSFW
jgi:uncharacterized protein YqgC (DUF456 family)